MDERTSDRLLDILEVADELAQVLSGCTAEDFAADKVKQRVAERLLEIAGEAASGLRDDAVAAISADWGRLRKMRDLLAHAYHRVEVQPLWQAATKSLPTLAQAIRDAYPAL